LFSCSPLAPHGGSFDLVDRAMGNVGLAVRVQPSGRLHESGVGVKGRVEVGRFEVGGCYNPVCTLHSSIIIV
jgi:hypothetical protein